MGRGPALTLPAPRTLAVLRWVLAYQGREGYMPTVREVAAAFKMKSTAGPRYHFRKLAAHGYLVPAGGRSRTMQVTEAGRAVAGP